MKRIRRYTSPARGKKFLHSRKETKIADYDRIKILGYGFSLFALLITIRLFIVQVLDHSFYAALASGQHELEQKLLPARGEIYAHDRFSSNGLAVIATNRTLQHVYTNPKQIGDAKKTSEAISSVLNVDPIAVEERLAKQNDLYEPIQHGVTDQELEALAKIIKEQQLTGINWSPEPARYYPEGPITSAMTGFVGYVKDMRKGQYGLEEFFDDQLRGKEGSLSTELDAYGRFIAVGDKSIIEAQDGDSLILTIDKNIQFQACSSLAKAVEQHGAKQGSLIMLNPKTGAILAYCNAPLYDPNNYGQVEDIEVYKNDIVFDQYEPGSVFKPLVMSAAINEGLVTPQTVYNDTGAVQIGRYTIKNSDGKAQGEVNMTKVLELSLNTGAIFAVQKVGNEKWRQYVENFGFGKKTGVEFGAENPGNIYTLTLNKDIYSATSSYGQGITVTPLQLIQAFAALANKGVIMKPYIVERVVKANGFEELREPVIVGQPITAETAQTIAAMMVRVVDFGHSKRAAVSGYYIAGKTGTAQIPKEDGVGYHPFRHKDTFVGFGPVSDPQIVILIKIDEPQDVMWAEGSAAPVFAEVAQYTFNYLHIPPDRETGGPVTP